MIRATILAATALALSACTASPTATIEVDLPVSTKQPMADVAVRAPDPAIVDRIVVELMQQQYGGERDAAAGCTFYVSKDGESLTRYCMKAATPEVVPSKQGHDLYLRTFNSLDAAGIDNYDAITPGLMGAFRVRIDADGRWRMLNASPALAFGTIGFCGCDKASFIKLGPDTHGWMFTSGGTWQGITVTNHEIVAPRNGGFANISAIPEIREEAQDVTYSVRMTEGDGSQAFWPLEVTKASDGKAEETRRVTFDAGAGVYRLPENF